jgi:broad specificity phosphatase PhoE
MTRIILTRHGHVEGIAPERFRGRAELPLTERGEAQAKAVAGRIAARWHPKAVYTSPMGRCVATGRQIASACGIESRSIASLNDIDYGLWQGKTHAEIRGAEGPLFEAWFATPHLVRFPKGDALQDLAARTADAVRFVIATHAGETDEIVLVGHESVNRVLLLQLLDLPLSQYWRLVQAPCTLNEIEIAAGRIRVLRLNETAHLDGLA